MDDGVEIAREGPVLHVMLTRTERGNALSYADWILLAAALDEAGADPDLRVVVVSGQGGLFCAGDSPEDLGAWPDSYRHRRPQGSHGDPPLPQQDALARLRKLPKPTLAVVEGSCLGVGLDLACACDIRMCADDAIFGDPRVGEARFGATGLTYVLPRLVGQSQAVRILLLGDCIPGPEAARIGLVYRSVAPEELGAASQKVVAGLAAAATRSYAVMKAQILDEADLGFEASLMHSLAIRQTNVIEDRLEGMAAFRERREPLYRGR
ncbi:MAG: enoyl-CoA hydratase/isomerase family protein [Acidimicrobiales bacterium]